MSILPWTFRAMLRQYVQVQQGLLYAQDQTKVKRRKGRQCHLVGSFHSKVNGATQQCCQGIQDDEGDAKCVAGWQKVSSEENEMYSGVYVPCSEMTSDCAGARLIFVVHSWVPNVSRALVSEIPFIISVTGQSHSFSHDHHLFYFQFSVRFSRTH